MCAQLLSTQPYKGTRDFYPADMRLRNWFFGVIRQVLETSAFEEYNGPMLESLSLYAAKSGEELAGEQTYNFVDKGNRHMAIRPEMTPTVARMVAAKMGELNSLSVGSPSPICTVAKILREVVCASSGR